VIGYFDNRIKKGRRQGATSRQEKTAESRINRKAKLQSWLESELVERFEGRILGVGLETVLAWGRFQGAAEQNGVTLPLMDSLIAATATAHGLSVVTRNVKDLKRCGSKVFNPWG